MMDSMETVTAAQAAALFNCTRETVRQWSLEFARYLSGGAQGGNNRQRKYTTDDLEVLALVSELKKSGMLYEDIHGQLANGDRRPAPIPSDSSLAKPDRNKLATLQQQIAEYHRQLTAALEDSQRKTGQIELLERQLAEAHTKIDRLIGENAVLKSKQE